MKTTHERFMEKIKVDEDTGCWEWQSAKTTDGYGRIFCDSKATLAHRWSYQHHVGEIPKGMCVCHKCDNPGCVNPDHLFIGTAQDNVNDMTAKGRSHETKGSRNGAAILNEENVRLIKQFLARHTVQMGNKGGQCDFLGRWFGVKSNTISLINIGDTCKHIK